MDKLIFEKKEEEGFLLGIKKRDGQTNTKMGKRTEQTLY